MQNFNEFSPFQYNYTININGFLIDFSTPRVMGVVNLTNDSFYANSRLNKEIEILKQVETFMDQGADFIDIGAFSSRPGAQLISEDEEREKLIPVVKSIIKTFPSTIISIDTYRSAIAYETANEGASIINDISGGSLDLNMFETIKKLNIPYILMHMNGKPSSMQMNPQYKNVCTEVYHSFFDRLTHLNQLGVKDIILDVGFGFGKTDEHNYNLLKNLSYFKKLGRPLLIGLSRKSMIQRIIKKNAKDSLNGTTVAHTIALLNGANILRVHDVTEAREVIQIVDFYQKQ